MKQVLQSFSTGQTSVEDVPAPKPGRAEVLVQVRASVVSAGTEKSVVEFAEKSLLAKAKSRPDLVRQVVSKAQREGVLATLDAVRNRLDKPLALGYSNAGLVLAVGEYVTEFRAGDRVACAGGGYAVHAEIVHVPRTLVAKIPSETVSYEDAAFATIGSIALHGVRLAEIQLGEVVVVIGLGLIGLLAVQFAKAAGAIVIGTDPAGERCALAEKLGADATAPSPEAVAMLLPQFSSAGADAVLITAATSSNEPVELAAELARDRARVVAVGAVGTTLPRKPYYEKELDFRISRSYGPGRYDASYEDEGRDYPIGFVRWTEGRNLHAFLALVAAGKVTPQALITHRFDIAEATRAYDLICGKTSEPFLGVLLRYPEQVAIVRRVELAPNTGTSAGKLSVGVVGAGNFAAATLLPAMATVAGVELRGIVAASGVSARHLGKKYGFTYCASDIGELLADPQIDTVVVATRHHLHASQVIGALTAGKNVFCEKPLCLSEEELAGIIQAHTDANGRWLMVGYNRRFAAMSEELKLHFHAAGEPLVMNCRVNAGFIPTGSWVHDPAQGGGRVLGELCHFIDLLMYLCDGVPVRVTCRAAGNTGRYSNDNVAVVVEFANGSLGTVTYTAAGDKSFPKERVEVFSAGRVGVLDDFRNLTLVRDGKSRVVQSRLRQDKGHAAEWRALVESVKTSGQSPIAMRDLIASTLATLAAQRSLQTDEPVRIDVDRFVASVFPS
jgi:predicted dehydrogenase/threonine dehydrogenase-like Zn-dependent dehydrogenase